MEHYLDKKNIELFRRTEIYTEVEMKSHYDVKLEKYCQILNIEVETMLEMVHKDIIPCTFRYLNNLADTLSKLNGSGAPFTGGKKLIKKLDSLITRLDEKTENLAQLHETTKTAATFMEKARSYADKILPAMNEVRKIADEIEPLLGTEYKPYPSYEDLLFSVQ